MTRNAGVYQPVHTVSHLTKQNLFFLLIIYPFPNPYVFFFVFFLFQFLRMCNNFGGHFLSRFYFYVPFT